MRSVTPSPDGASLTVAFEGGGLECDGVIVSVPHDEAATVLPAAAVAHQDRLAELGSSAVVDVHLVYDRRVTDWELMAGHHSPVQWVFDRSDSAGLDRPGPRSPQYLAVSLSAADSVLGRRNEELVADMTQALGRLLPRARQAKVVDSLVTKERHATFRARPGTGRLRPAARTAYPALAVAGAWTDTGWPATMEGAVRSGRRAAASILADLRSPGVRSPRTDDSTQEVA